MWEGVGMKVIKRDGTTVDFDPQKIVVAIEKANAAVEESCRIEESKIKEIAEYVHGKNRPRLLVEDIQDIVERQLQEAGKFDLAKAYIIYRYRRALVRKANTTDESILTLIRNSNKDVMEENSNKNAIMASTQRDLIAGEVSTEEATISTQKASSLLRQLVDAGSVAKTDIKVTGKGTQKGYTLA